MVSLEDERERKREKIQKNPFTFEGQTSYPGLLFRIVTTCTPLQRLNRVERAKVFFLKKHLLSNPSLILMSLPQDE